MLAAAGIGAASYHPGVSLMRSLVEGIISKAQADTTPGAQPRAVINYHLNSAPLRTRWDLPISPYANGAPSLHPLAGTKFVNGKPTYVTTPVATAGGTLYMPWIWSTPIPTSSGGSVPMSTLIKNMLGVIGVKGNSASHPEGLVEKTRPVSGSPSIMGSVADASNAPLQAAFSGSGYVPAFAANHSTQVLATDQNTAIAQLLAPFNRAADTTSSTFLSRRAAMDTLVQSALSSLGNYAKSSAPGSESLFAMRNSAELLMKNGVAAALASYPATRLKYQNLIKACATITRIGFNDQPIPLPTATTYGVNETLLSGSAAPTYIQNPDLRTMISASASPYWMAENFAVAEILVSLGLSSSVSLITGALTGLDYVSPLLYGTKAPAPSSNYWGFDEHMGGPITSLVADSFMYTCLSACIYELQTKLTNTASPLGGTLWEQSLLVVTSDFGRNPRKGIGLSAGDYSGSDHDPSACNYSIFSGALSSGNFIGNTGATPDDGTYAGSWGQNRPVSNLFGSTRSIVPADVVSTIAMLARVASPTANNPSLVDASGVPLIEKSKEVA
jgi:hypothetical protein